MEVTPIMDLITTIGFPTALVVVLLWFIFKLQAESKERENKLVETVTQFSVKFNEITVALTKVTDTLSALTDRVIDIENKLED